MKPYRIPFARHEEVKKLLDQMQKKLTPSKNPWSSPIVLTDKKGRFNQILCRLKKS